jgi:hypothetical protein
VGQQHLSSAEGDAGHRLLRHELRALLLQLLGMELHGQLLQGSRRGQDVHRLLLLGPLLLLLWKVQGQAVRAQRNAGPRQTWLLLLLLLQLLRERGRKLDGGRAEELLLLLLLLLRGSELKARRKLLELLLLLLLLLLRPGLLQELDGDVHTLCAHNCVSTKAGTNWSVMWAM